MIVPEKDPNGIVNNFREDGSIPASSVRKDRVKVLGRTIEGTNYPGYEFLEWRYHMKYREPVDPDNIPTVKMRR